MSHVTALTRMATTARESELETVSFAKLVCFFIVSTAVYGTLNLPRVYMY